MKKQIDNTTSLDVNSELEQLNQILKTINEKYLKFNDKNLYDAEVKVRLAILALKTIK